MNKSRPKQMTFRLSEKEKEQLQKKIDESGMKSQEYILKAVLNAPIVNNDDLKELIVLLKSVSAELGKQGGNLNQVALRLNERKYIDYSGELNGTLTECRKSYKELQNVWQLLKQYLQRQK